MSKYRRIAEEANNLVQRTFDQYEKAKQRLDTATANYKSYKKPNAGIWMTDAEKIAEYAETAKEYELAGLAFNQAQLAMNSAVDQLHALRCNLISEIKNDFAINPKDIDEPTLFLLNAGIATPEDYDRFLQYANPTMAKLITDSARKRADAETDRALSAKFREIGSRSTNDGQSYIEAFDFLRLTFEKTVNNPGMMDYWNALTGETIESF